MALTKTECTVLAQWDGGATARQIAAATGLTFARVSQIIETYHDRGTREHRSAMAKGSAVLRDAILALTRPSASRSRTLVWNTRTLADVDGQHGAVA